MSFRSSAYFPSERWCFTFTKLVNLSLAEGIFPPIFKKMVVTTLIKKASLPNKDLKNYHPVSGLCFMSKLVVVKPVTPPKMRFISHYHVVNLLHSSYSICQQHSIQLITLLLLIVLSHGVWRGHEAVCILSQPPIPSN